ncbi:unnamed protein product [Euphydryas editha]|uniref:Uncharacterized protein n=1 Tax=Euphydryas editha TaxID=104508 RepID=A0AAU9V871_EUPED|nr:unnamed protein product [Euphydryas editha]
MALNHIDGVSGCFLSIVLEYLRGWLRGQFLKPKETSRLCLLYKEGRTSDSSLAYRPIALLDETANILEKILPISSRPQRHRAGPLISAVPIQDETFHLRRPKRSKIFLCHIVRHTEYLQNTAFLLRHSFCCCCCLLWLSKMMIVDRTDNNQPDVQTIGGCEVVESYVYLGYTITKTGDCEDEI